MIQLADALDLIDRLAAWLPGELRWLPADVRAVVVLPAVVVAVCVVPRIVVHRLFPWLGRYLLLPVIVLVSAVVAVGALTVDFVLTQLFRIFWLPLTAVHFAIGDLAVAGTAGLRSVTRSAVGRSGRWLRRFNPGLLLIAGVALALWWNATYCDRNPTAGCVAPIAKWGHDTWALWQSLFD